MQGCCGQWLACTKEVLERNGINVQYFTQCILELLEKGQEKCSKRYDCRSSKLWENLSA